MLNTYCQFAVSYSCPPSPVHPTTTGVIPYATTQPTTVPNFPPTEPASTTPTITILTEQSAVRAQIAAAVPATIVIMIIPLIIVSFLVGVGVYKRRNKTFQDTHRPGK